MTDFSHDLGVMLGRILERSEQTIVSLGQINQRMDRAEEWRGKASGELIGIRHRLQSLERSHKGQKKNHPPRAERWSKKIIAGAIPVGLMWITQPTEHALEVIKAALELLKAMKGTG